VSSNAGPNGSPMPRSTPRVHPGLRYCATLGAVTLPLRRADNAWHADPRAPRHTAVACRHLAGQRPGELRRRQRLALLISLLVHGALLSLTFDDSAIGLPGLGWPWQERRAEVPELRVRLKAPSIASPDTRACTAPLPGAALQLAAHAAWVLGVALEAQRAGGCGAVR
jgi:hypothetical protein